MRWRTSRRTWNSANQEGDLQEAPGAESAIRDGQLERQSRGPFRAGGL
jgi:hypothetical protein